MKRSGYTLSALRKDAGMSIVDGRPAHNRNDDILSNPTGSEQLGRIVIALSSLPQDSVKPTPISLPSNYFEEQKPDDVCDSMSMENTDSAGSVGTVDSDAGVSTSDLDSRGPALSNRKQTERIIPEGIKCYNLESELPMRSNCFPLLD